MAKLYLEEKDREEKKEDEQGEREESENKRKTKKTISQRLFPVRLAFKNVYKLYTAVDTFACSTAICEWPFSSLGILDRVHMTNQRLRNLSFLAFESKELAKISPETILKDFNASKNQRLQLF